jgi:hypothetical protein
MEQNQKIKTKAVVTYSKHVVSVMWYTFPQKKHPQVVQQFPNLTQIFSNVSQQILNITNFSTIFFPEFSNQTSRSKGNGIREREVSLKDKSTRTYHCVEHTIDKKDHGCLLRNII